MVLKEFAGLKGGGSGSETIETIAHSIEGKSLQSIANEIYWTKRSITSSGVSIRLYNEEIVLWKQILSNQERMIPLLEAEKERILQNNAVEVKYAGELQELIDKNSSILTTIDKKLESDKEERENMSEKLYATSVTDIEDILQRINTLNREQIAQELFNLQVEDNKIGTISHDLYYTTIHDLKQSIKMNDSRIDTLKSDCEGWVNQHINLKERGLL
jgi:hypothetical protein